MTLVVVAGNSQHFIQVSDRQLTTDTGPDVLPRNKAVVVDLADARLLVGFTGIARSGGFKTGDWMVDALAEAAPPDHLAKPTVERFLKLAEATLGSHSDLASLPPSTKGLTFLFSGFTYAEPPWPVAALGSNFQDFRTGVDHPNARPAFEVLFESMRRELDHEPTYVQAIGALSLDGLEGLRTLLNV